MPKVAPIFKTARIIPAEHPLARNKVQIQKSFNSINSNPWKYSCGNRLNNALLRSHVPSNSGRVPCWTFRKFYIQFVVCPVRCSVTEVGWLWIQISLIPFQNLLGYNFLRCCHQWTQWTARILGKVVQKEKTVKKRAKMWKKESDQVSEGKPYTPKAPKLELFHSMP